MQRCRLSESPQSCAHVTPTVFVCKTAKRQTRIYVNNLIILKGRPGLRMSSYTKVNKLFLLSALVEIFSPFTIQVSL